MVSDRSFSPQQCGQATVWPAAPTSNSRCPSQFWQRHLARAVSGFMESRQELLRLGDAAFAFWRGAVPQWQISSRCDGYPRFLPPVRAPVAVAARLYHPLTKPALRLSRKHFRRGEWLRFGRFRTPCSTRTLASSQIPGFCCRAAGRRAGATEHKPPPAPVPSLANFGRWVSPLSHPLSGVCPSSLRALTRAVRIAASQTCHSGAWRFCRLNSAALAHHKRLRENQLKPTARVR